ncbi:hypothetical protein GCM10020229_00950 [Kitasatospora albolonga]
MELDGAAAVEEAEDDAEEDAEDEEDEEELLLVQPLTRATAASRAIPGSSSRGPVGRGPAGIGRVGSFLGCTWDSSGSVRGRLPSGLGSFGRIAPLCPDIPNRRAVSRRSRSGASAA